MAKLRLIPTKKSPPKPTFEERGKEVILKNKTALLHPLMSFFPQFLFNQELDVLWVELMLNDELSKEKEEDHRRALYKWADNLTPAKVEILLQSPPEYLSGGEIKALIIIKMRNYFQKTKAFSSRKSKIKEHHGLCQEMLNQIEHWDMILVDGHEDRGFDSGLLNLARSFLLFDLALTSENSSIENQRKIITLAHHHLNVTMVIHKAVEDHPYFLLMSVLYFIAKDKWEHSTRILHNLSKKYPSPELYKVLIELYTKIELPNVARYFEQKSQSLTNSNLKNKNLETHFSVA